MTRITADSDLRAKLQGFADLVEICDEQGQLVGFFHPARQDDRNSGKISSPISDEDIELARQQRSGRPLADVFADLDPRS